MLDINIFKYFEFHFNTLYLLVPLAMFIAMHLIYAHSKIYQGYPYFSIFERKDFALFLVGTIFSIAFINYMMNTLTFDVNTVNINPEQMLEKIEKNKNRTIIEAIFTFLLNLLGFICLMYYGLKSMIITIKFAVIGLIVFPISMILKGITGNGLKIRYMDTEYMRERKKKMPGYKFWIFKVES